MLKRGRTLLGITLALGLFALVNAISWNVFSAFQTSRTLPTVGSLKGIGVGVYWNSACTDQTTSLNWWAVDPGTSRTITLYVRNEGNSAVTLSKVVQNWNPSAASSYMTLNWDYNGQTLSVNQVLPVKITLIVSPTVSGITNFSFDTTIIATG